MRSVELRRRSMAAWFATLLAIQFAAPFAAPFVSVSQAAEQKLVHSERSLYREVLVYEDGEQRCMCFTRMCMVGRQTCVEMHRPERFVMNYTQMMMASLFAKPAPRSILIVGLGGGTLPKALSQMLPQAQIDVVEIDPAVVRVAKQYFGFKSGARLQVTEQDGRVFVKRALRERRQYDLIMLDAFDHEYIPEHLLTQEFLQEVKALLAPGAVLAANTFSSSRLYDHESVTYASVFGPFLNLKRANRVIIAANGPIPDRDALQANSRAFQGSFKALGFDADDLLTLMTSRRDWNVRARVLTDQYSPANLLNRE